MNDLHIHKVLGLAVKAACVAKQDLLGWQNCWVGHSASVQRQVVITFLMKEVIIKDCAAVVFVRQHAQTDCMCACCTAQTAEQCLKNSMLLCKCILE